MAVVCNVVTEWNLSQLETEPVGDSKIDKYYNESRKLLFVFCIFS